MGAKHMPMVYINDRFSGVYCCQCQKMLQRWYPGDEWQHIHAHTLYPVCAYCGLDIQTVQKEAV